MQAAPAIKSRPVYAPVGLQPQAQFHLFICQSEGLHSLRPLIDATSASPRSVLVFGPRGGAGSEYGRCCDPASLDNELAPVLTQAPMATAIYIAGEEAFLWEVHKRARGMGFADEQIRLCAPVNTLRRVFCTHCYGLMEKVSHSPVTCSGCRRPLLVRDHFSRALGAYVGVQVNAEDPSEQPQTEELR